MLTLVWNWEDFWTAVAVGTVVAAIVTTILMQGKDD